MKKYMLLLLLSTSLVACGGSNATLDNNAQKAAYSLGYKSGVQLGQRLPEVDIDAFVAGLRVGAKGGDSKLSDDDMKQALAKFRQKLVAERKSDHDKAAKKNLKKAKAFLKKNADKDDVKTLPDGIQYIVEESGDTDGASPTLKDTVVADYTGSLLDGTVFDSSVKRGKPATFPLANVIKGWQKALVHMHVGDKWKIFIPPELAYGEHGAGSVIGPNELLVFEVKLEKVIPADKKDSGKSADTDKTAG